MTLKRITKVAGASLVGFVAISIAADKVAPNVSQVAGFLGAFLGSLAAGTTGRSKEDSDPPPPPRTDGPEP